MSAPATAAASPVTLLRDDRSLCTQARKTPSPIGTPTDSTASSSSSSGDAGHRREHDSTPRNQPPSPSTTGYSDRSTALLLRP